MGKKGGKGGSKPGKGGYVHKVTANDRAHESEERRLRLLRKLKVLQLQKSVDAQIARMCAYVPDEVMRRKARKIDPQYDLKGAARVAREYYKDPGDKREKGDDVEVDLLELYGSNGRLWRDCPYDEGRVLLTRMLKLAVGLHNITQQTSEACDVLERMISFDSADHLQARQVLLRCYLDTAQGEKAREVAEEALHQSSSSRPSRTEEKQLQTDVKPYAHGKKRRHADREGQGFYRGTTTEVNTFMASDPEAAPTSAVTQSVSSAPDTSACCFHYALALLEHISLHVLNEPGSSIERANAALSAAYAANPYALFLLAYHKVFRRQGPQVVSAEEREERSKAKQQLDDETEEGGVLEFTEYLAPHYSDIVRDTAVSTGHSTHETTKHEVHSLPAGSVEDAISFFVQDLDLWEDTEGALPWVQSFLVQRGLLPPARPADDSSSDEGEQQQDEEEEEVPTLVAPEESRTEDDEDDDLLEFDETFEALSARSKHRMYLGMFYTGLQMADVAC